MKMIEAAKCRGRIMQGFHLSLKRNQHVADITKRSLRHPPNCTWVNSIMGV